MDRDAFWNGFIDQVAVEDDGKVRFHRIGTSSWNSAMPRNSTTASTTS